MQVTFELEGLDEIDAGLSELDVRTRSIYRAVIEEAESIMAVSKEHFVPVDQGVLRSSGTVKVVENDGTVTAVELTYGGASAPYAVTVHENPRAGRTGGLTPSGRMRKHWASVGQWKYLEQPFLAAQSGMLGRIGERVGQILGLS